jgi:hypothetical protein
MCSIRCADDADAPSGLCKLAGELMSADSLRAPGIIGKRGGDLPESGELQKDELIKKTKSKIKISKDSQLTLEHFYLQIANGDHEF